MKNYMGILTMFVLSLMIFTIFNQAKQAKESFTYFPTNDEVLFQSAETTLTFMNDTNKGYELLWRTGSKLDRKAYLRQDISLLFGNGKLVAIMGKEWKQNADKIILESSIIQNESANYKAISFHHAEIHSNEQITSSQKHSHDELYVLDSKFHPLHSFRLPVHQQDEEWKKLIDDYMQNKLDHTLETAQRQYQLDPNQYTIFPLTSIYKYEELSLPGFDDTETKEIVGRLWEGLYKNYFLGIKKKDGTITDPIGSTIPLILLAKDQTHLFVISELMDDETMLLKQRIVQTPHQ
jgi:hypothetical protein